MSVTYYFVDEMKREKTPSQCLGYIQAGLSIFRLDKDGVLFNIFAN